MTNYPTGFDNNITLPGVSGSSQEDMAITALRSAVFAIETELGITPSGIYPDVRTRLDILEARIQFGVSPQIPNDGYVKSPLILWNVPQNIALTISDGYGAPTENRVNGSLYLRALDGYANNDLYVRRNGAWFPVQTEQFTATHDLRGFPFGTDGHLAQTVIGLYNHPLRSTMDTVGAVQDGYHLTWNNVDGYWEPQTGFIPGHDLLAFSGPYGRTGQTVIGLQGFSISGTTPTDGYTLVWQGSDSRWEPQARAVVFDGYVSRVNLRSNRAQQSPILNTQTGIVNLSTSTNGSGGATGSYSIILGGDRNTASGTHGMVLGGFSNLAQDGYSLVVHGNSNTATNANSVVLNGVLNTASANNATVINGTGHVAAATFSTILNGSSHSINAGATHAAIGFGTGNQITGGGNSTFSLILSGSNNSTNTQNVLIGTAASALVQSNYAIVLSGTSGTIGTNSDYSIIHSGTTNQVSNNSGFAFIGTGNLITTTGLYATVLNATTATANGLHSLVLNGNTQSVTGSFSTIVNGNNNTISGAVSYSTIVDGYQNSISSTGGFIADGYNNTVSGLWSSILNGNFNTVAGRNSTVLNGTTNNIDTNSIESTVIVGDNNTFTNSANTTAVGSGNVFTNATQTFVIGTLNNIQSTTSFINGSTNTLLAGTSFNRMFGSFNNIGTNSTTNFMIGNGNNIGPNTTTSNTFALGSNNIIDGATGGSINGNSNIIVANLTNIHGQYGKARMFGQEVRSNGRFTGTTVSGASIGATLPQATINVVSTTNFPASGTVAINTTTGLQTVAYTATTGTSLTGCTGGTGVMSATSGVGKIGEVQWSRLVLDGYSTSVGAAVPLQLQDTVLTNPTFVDGYSYDMSIKVLVVNTSPISPNPVVPARYYIDVLAHQESGTLVLDNINFTLSTPNTVDSVTRTPWTVSVTAVGNQLVLQVDPEVPSSYVQPTNSPSNRRAIASIDMREISRI